MSGGDYLVISWTAPAKFCSNLIAQVDEVYRVDGKLSLSIRCAYPVLTAVDSLDRRYMVAVVVLLLLLLLLLFSLLSDIVRRPLPRRWVTASQSISCSAWVCFVFSSSGVGRSTTWSRSWPELYQIGRSELDSACQRPMTCRTYPVPILITAIVDSSPMAKFRWNERQ